jgi:hypothetical protein
MENAEATWKGVGDVVAFEHSFEGKQRAALVLTDLLGYPADEAGRMLGVGGSTVRSLSSTAPSPAPSESVT